MSGIERTILVRAAEIVDGRGHCRSALQYNGKPKQGVCLYEALTIAGMGVLQSRLTAILNGYLGTRGAAGNALWNDCHTKTEVIAALRGAAGPE